MDKRPKGQGGEPDIAGTITAQPGHDVKIWVAVIHHQKKTMETRIILYGTYIPVKPTRGEDDGRVISKGGISPTLISVGGALGGFLQ